MYKDRLKKVQFKIKKYPSNLAINCKPKHKRHIPDDKVLFSLIK